MNICLYVCILCSMPCLDEWADVDEIFRVCLSGLKNYLDSQLELVSPAQRVARTGILTKFLLING